MSNILIIKHGSLGDIAQISGVIKDIKENFKEDEIYILTTPPFIELLLDVRIYLEFCWTEGCQDGI